MSVEKIYCLSGIGADKRIFQYLDIPNTTIVHIAWIKPNAGEGLQAYAKRIFLNIPEEKFTLLGVSFGGMIATEIAKLYPTAQVIICSSAKTFDEIPFYLRILKWIPLYKIVPDGLMHHSNAVFYYLFGAATIPVKKIMQDIMRDTDASFIRWAMGAVLHWKNKERPKNLIHLQGNKDLILPHYFLEADQIIEGGTHLMILEKASLIGEKILAIISKKANTIEKESIQ